ncbi:MAG: LuxR C-terminal-related transcriptional regulator, partial [Actinomycetota bacterium]
AVVDYWLPGMDGPATARGILRDVPGCRIVMLSWFHGPEQIGKALAAGANAFLPKSSTLEELAAQVRLAFAGESSGPSAKLEELTATLTQRQEAVEELSGRLGLLTRKERSVLNALRYGAPLDSVASELFISLPTLKSHIRSILRKTGARSRSEAVAMALYCGMIQV